MRENNTNKVIGYKLKAKMFIYLLFMLEVLYEDNHIIAVNKKISDIVQADKTGDTPLSEEVKAYIKKKYNKPGAVFPISMRDWLSP